MNQSATWVPMLSALLTPTIAILGSYIVWQQWRTNRNSLKLDLFERRCAHYEAARKLIGTVLTSGQASSDTTFRFLMNTRGAQFIVGKDIARYFDEELYARAIDLQTLEAELQGVGVGPGRTDNVHRQRDIKTWFNAQNDVLDRRFSPLLQLRH